MLRSFVFTGATTLAAVVAILLIPETVQAARALRPAEILAARYQAAYDAAMKAADRALAPPQKIRRCAQQAANSVAGDNGGVKTPTNTSNAATEAALKAAAAALSGAPQRGQMSQIKLAYQEAWNAAFKSLSSDQTNSPAPANVADLPGNLEEMALRGAKIRADQDAATITAARAVARAISKRTAAEESADAGEN